MRVFLLRSVHEYLVCLQYSKYSQKALPSWLAMQDPSAEPDRPATFKWERVCRRASMPVTKSEQTTSMTWLESHEQRASTDVHPTHMHPSYPCTHMHGSQSQESVSTSGDPQNIIKCTTSSIIYIGHGLHNTVSTHAIEQP